MLLIPLAQSKESTSLCYTATSLNNKANDFAYFLHRALIKMPFNLFSHKVNAHIAKVSERALLEQQVVSEKWEDGTDYIQDEPTEAPGDVVPEYQSNQALLEQQAVSETREGTDYMQGGTTEAPGDVVPEYRSKQTRYGITSTYAIGKSKAYSARLSDRCINACMQCINCMRCVA